MNSEYDHSFKGSIHIVDIMLVLTIHTVVPRPPEDLRVEVLNVAVRISWQPPLITNGIIIFYNITYNGSRYEPLPVSKKIVCDVKPILLL